MFRVIIILVSAITLCGCVCGFKLRGNYDIPQDLKTVYITPDNPFDPFQVRVRKLLKINNIKVICEPRDGVTRLYLGDTQFGEQVLAIGPSGQVQRFKYTLTVDYSLTATDTNLKNTITRSRELGRSNNMLLSNQGEERIVRQELLDEAANALLRQIISRPTRNCAAYDSSTIDDSPC